jgi:hypothetical protein
MEAMSDLQARIKAATEEFTGRLLGMLRNITIEDLARHLPVLPLSMRAAPARVGKAVAKAAKKAPATKPAKPAAAPKRVITNTPKLQAARKLQGQYLGLLRKFDGAKRLELKALAKKESVAAAVNRMKKLLHRT